MITRDMPSTRAVFGRLLWMIVGPFALAIVAISISERRGGGFSLLDLIYFGIASGMLLGRWLEFRDSQPLTATGEPATAAHLRRYTVLLSLLASGIWLAAHLVALRAIGLPG